MIIPIKCVTCGKVLADKYLFYKSETAKRKGKEKAEGVSNTIYFTDKNTKKSVEGEVMDELGLTRYCCRRVILTHVDIE